MNNNTRESLTMELGASHPEGICFPPVHRLQSSLRIWTSIIEDTNTRYHRNSAYNSSFDNEDLMFLPFGLSQIYLRICSCLLPLREARIWTQISERVASKAWHTGIIIVPRPLHLQLFHAKLVSLHHELLQPRYMGSWGRKTRNGQAYVCSLRIHSNTT
ncbi:hypothetical protein PSPO01_06921 [Paraphaeosphaeria sporulosa]